MASTTENDEDRRKLLKPKVSADQVLSVLNEFYITKDQHAEVICELDSYDDANYLVKIDGEKALFKIHNGVESEKYIQIHSAKRSKGNHGGISANEGSIIDLHSAIFEHLAKPEYNVTTCQTIHVKNRPSGQNDGDSSVCVKELPVRLFFITDLDVAYITTFHGIPTLTS